MKTKKYAAGARIFSEGDPSDYVGLILSGSVEVVKEMGDWPVVLGTVGAGEYVGEMGVIERQPRGASIRAQSEVELEILSELGFYKRITDDKVAAMNVIRRLSERLRATNEMLAEIENAAAATLEAVEAPGPNMGVVETAEPVASSLANVAQKVMLLADSPRTEDAVPRDGVVVESFPFYVGRVPEKWEGIPAVELGLAIEEESEPFRLSRVHFSIREYEGAFLLSDPGSTMGTLVNGEFIGRHAPQDFARLYEGENQILAGGVDSPYGFRVIVGNL